jgi:uncharacterized protein YgiM (DUF1202 family)
MRRSLFLGVLLLLTLGVVQADSSGPAQTVVAANMNDGPYSDANVVGNVPVNTNLTIISRQGGWYHVRLASGQDGWLPMTSLRLNPAGGASGSSTPQQSSSSGFFSLFESGRSGASGTTATTGVRGLNTGDIANAQPNPAAVAELDQWTMKPADATAFAQQLPLKAVKVDYLPKVKP